MLQSIWFQSYPYKREQIVSCENQLSGKCQLQIGVPQGSALGPLLFLIYVNGINRHVHLGSCLVLSCLVYRPTLLWSQTVRGEAHGLG